jgi:hypothetical protein
MLGVKSLDVGTCRAVLPFDRIVPGSIARAKRKFSALRDLFHPRTENWNDHFRWDGVVVVGLSPTGRATVAALQLNRSSILAIRLEEAERGRHPPPRRIRRQP